jgi:threonine/homoserine/homoserine lactone efflux protein
VVVEPVSWRRPGWHWEQTTHSILAALGLAVLLRSYPASLQAVHIVGAVYLAYLAFQTFRSLRNPAEDDPKVDGRTALRQAFIVNLTNPKIILFFASFLPHFVGDADGYAGQFLMLGAVFLVIGFVIDAAIGIAAGQLRASSGGGGGTRTGLTLLAGATYAVLSALLLVKVA